MSQQCAGVTVWTGKPDGLPEVYTADRTPAVIYVNIKGPVEIDEAGIRYVDYEPDVSRKLPGPAVIVDEDESREAAEMLGYSAEFESQWLARQDVVELCS